MTFIKNNSYIVFIIFLCAGLALIGVSKNLKEHTYMEVTIVEGDTLWALATHHADEVPPGQWINEVMKVNGMTSPAIRSGESLKLPAKNNINDSKFGTQMAGDER